jgi:hypothetical protein
MPTIKELYHFTDRRNLPSIQETGGLYSYALLKEMEIEISAPGGNDWSHDADTQKGMDRYVHLCFREKHPMEYRAKEDGRIVSSIFLRISTDVLQIEGVRFTGEVSNKSGVEPCSIDEALSIIDFEMLDRRWKNYCDPEINLRLQQVERYEILVPDHIPLDSILNFPHG